MKSAERRSIPTRYKGVRFRSKLEADWARAFDALGIEWEYEREGAYYGDVFYLPDFWLPRSRQFVEVKGVFEPSDCRKIQALLGHVGKRPHTSEGCPDFPIIAAIPDGVFYGWSRGTAPLDWAEFLLRTKPLALMRCHQCDGSWFGDEDMSWRCQCCGAYDGNGHLADVIASPLPGWPNIHPRRAVA